MVVSNFIMSFIYNGRKVPSVVKIYPNDICADSIAQKAGEVTIFNHGGSGI